MKSSRNIIFLDIDGVVNTFNHHKRQEQETGEISHSNWCPVACRHISHLCRRFNARIVISSTWRYSYTMEELREVLIANNIDPDYMIDVTPDLINGKEDSDASVRGDEIAAWLKENSDGATYVIIDDLPASEFREEQHANLVRVEQDTGFALEEAVVKAGEILERD